MKKEELKIKPFLDEKTIAEKVKELGKQISKDYVGKELVVIGVLKGSFVFLSDLVRHINVPLDVEFMGVTSYEGTSSTGHVRITTDLSADIQGCHVLLVEDIVDTGMTLDYIINLLKVRAPASLKVCAFLSKPDAHIMKHKLDYVGFEITNEFVIGYGLDYNGKYRELPYVARVEINDG